MTVAYRTGQTRYLACSGDSIPNAFGMPSHTYGFGRYISDKLGGVSWIMTGRNSQQTSVIESNFAADVLVHSPSIVIIEGGVNDITAGTSSATTIQNLKDMIDAAIADGVLLVVFLEILYASTLNGTQNTNRLAINSAVSAYINGLSGPHFSTNKDSVTSAGFTIDGLHPSIKGHLQIGEGIGDDIIAA